MYKKYIAEGVGTFGLSFAVVLAVLVGSTSIPVPIIAGLTLGLFVYTIGPISGSHINPAVTLAQLAVRKISSRDAGIYIIAQFIGAGLDLAVANSLGATATMISTGGDSGRVFFAEVIGSFFFNFGIAGVVYGKTKERMSGIVVGGSLVLGIIIASISGSLGILNPAVALALDAFSPLYIVSPIVW